MEDPSHPFYYSAEFWINFLVGLLGLVFSVLAFMEARQAKRAASAAGTTVKIQTVTVELSEIVQRLDRIDPKIEFSDARDLLSEVSRRLRRLIAPFQAAEEFGSTCEKLKSILDDARSSLDALRPTQDLSANVTPSGDAVYFAVQGYFSSIGSIVAEIIGLLEKRSINVEHV